MAKSLYKLTHNAEKTLVGVFVLTEDSKIVYFDAKIGKVLTESEFMFRFPDPVNSRKM